MDIRSWNTMYIFIGIIIVFFAAILILYVCHNEKKEEFKEESEMKYLWDG